MLIRTTLKMHFIKFSNANFFNCHFIKLVLPTDQHLSKTHSRINCRKKLPAISPSGFPEPTLNSSLKSAIHHKPKPTTLLCGLITRTHAPTNTWDHTGIIIKRFKAHEPSIYFGYISACSLALSYIRMTTITGNIYQWYLTFFFSLALSVFSLSLCVFVYMVRTHWSHWTLWARQTLTTATISLTSRASSQTYCYYISQTN